MSVVVNGGTPQVFALTPSTNANCSNAGGNTVCTNLQAVAPPGTDAFTFTMYKEAAPLPPTPTVLSVATVSGETVQQGVANLLGTFTLNPVLGSIAMSLTQPGGGFAPGTASSGNAINITAKDPSGATIIGPGSYANGSNTATPISLTSSTTPFTFSIDSAAATATGALNGTSDTAQLSYSGAAVNGTTTITAAATGVTSATQTISSLTAPITATLNSSAAGGTYHIVTTPPELDFYESGISGTVALSESGYSGTFTLNSSTCSSSWITFSPTVGNTGTTFTANAVGAGTATTPAICTATFKDSFSQTLSVTFSVTTISFGLQ